VRIVSFKAEKKECQAEVIFLKEKRKKAEKKKK